MAAPVETGLTVDDLARYERDDGRRYELIDGALYVSPAAALRHQRVALRVARRLLEYAETHGGDAFGEVNVSLSDRDLVIPDALLCSAETVARSGSELAVDVPPDLVVEVSSPSTRRYDLVTKRAHYERVGVLEYWFVDLDADRVEVYRRVDDRFGPPAIVGRGGVLEPPHLPGLAVAVDDVLADPRTG